MAHVLSERQKIMIFWGLVVHYVVEVSRGLVCPVRLFASLHEFFSEVGFRIRCILGCADRRDSDIGGALLWCVSAAQQ